MCPLRIRLRLPKMILLNTFLNTFFLYMEKYLLSVAIRRRIRSDALELEAAGLGAGGVGAAGIGAAGVNAAGAHASGIETAGFEDEGVRAFGGLEDN